jgi:hypothetical protein
MAARSIPIEVQNYCFNITNNHPVFALDVIELDVEKTKIAKSSTNISRSNRDFIYLTSLGA